MKSFLKLLVMVPIIVLGTVFAVANRTPVPVTLDPPGWFDIPPVQAPLFLIVFVAMAVGVVLGGVAVWFGQSRHRKAARANARAAAKHKAEVDRLSATSMTALPAPSTIR
ncbi:MAG: lipopolysaccharide assembly protein LapA domain-containing protein [Alsobacter sp.]